MIETELKYEDKPNISFVEPQNYSDWTCYMFGMKPNGGSGIT